VDALNIIDGKRTPQFNEMHGRYDVPIAFFNLRQDNLRPRYGSRIEYGQGGLDISGNINEIGCFYSVFA